MAYTLQELENSSSLPCTCCNGTGLTSPIKIDETRTIPSRECPHCEGVSTFNAVEVSSLLELVKGRKKGTLRSRRPDNSRAYYVWRFARFHGGVDVTLPMQAEFEVSGDPYIPILAYCAEQVAKVVYGTDRAGATRWANALGYNLPVKDLPATAQKCGPERI
ncbi:MAG: hypothetical protein GY887_16065 [Halieaceae bacterium]|jgi:hypothetical protein|nr:hypothetical protein [Halieaceae bacterium]